MLIVLITPTLKPIRVRPSTVDDHRNMRTWSASNFDSDDTHLLHTMLLTCLLVHYQSAHAWITLTFPLQTTHRRLILHFPLDIFHDCYMTNLQARVAVKCLAIRESKRGRNSCCWNRIMTVALPVGPTKGTKWEAEGRNLSEWSIVSSRSRVLATI